MGGVILSPTEQMLAEIGSTTQRCYALPAGGQLRRSVSGVGGGRKMACAKDPQVALANLTTHSILSDSDCEVWRLDLTPLLF